jgi:hypothetical protein
LNVVAWFLSAWRGDGRDLRACLDQWGRMKQLDLVLRDIALRGSLYQPFAVSDPVELARLEGRRELALEILTQAEADPHRLWQTIVASASTPPKTPSRKEPSDE